ncbi:MAG: hypothetical protein ACYC6A_09010 [Armatimonadota bacterium]
MNTRFRSLLLRGLLVIAVLLVVGLVLLARQAGDDRTILGLWVQSRLNRPLPPAVVVPPQPLPTPNGFVTFQQAGMALVDEQAITQAYHASDLAAKRKQVTANAKALTLLRQSFGQAFQQPRPFPEDDDVHCFHAVQTFSRLLRMEMDVAQAKHDWFGVARCAIDEIAFGTQLQHAGSTRLIGGGFAMQPDGCARLWGVLDHLDAGQARQLNRRLAGLLREQPSAADSLQAVEWQMVALNQHEVNAATAQPTKENRFTRQVRFRELHHFDEYMQAMMTRARRPYQQLGPLPPTSIGIGDLLVQHQLNVIKAIPFAFTRRDTLKRLLLVSLALRQYRVEHGRYPKQLADLTPAYLAEIPDDPFALKAPFRYRLTGDTYLLYSVGPDGQDDGGKAISDTAMDSRSTGDLVAGGTP